MLFRPLEESLGPPGVPGPLLENHKIRQIGKLEGVTRFVYCSCNDSLQSTVEWIAILALVLETVLLLEINSNLTLKCSKLAIKYLSAFYRQGIVLGTAEDMSYEKGLLFSSLIV